MILYKSMNLSEVIRENPTTIPVLGRFGIRLGVGDKTVEECARECGADPEFIIAVLNTYLNDSFFPEKQLRTFRAGQIIDYMSKTNEYYRRFQIPTTEKHLFAFVAMGGAQNGSLAEICNIWKAFREKLSAMIDRDEVSDFPKYRQMLDESAFDSPTRGIEPATDDEEEAIESLLEDMQNILIKYVGGDYDQNMCYAVIFSLNRFERDLRQNNRIRRRILLPLISGLDKSQ